MRVPLLGRFNRACNPTAKQQWPKSDRSWKDEKSECRATTVGLRVDALYSDGHESESKNNSKKRI